jgi:hypothetical protein
MSVKKWISLAVVLTGLVLLMILVVRAGPPAQGPEPQRSIAGQAGVGTGFIYQGRLESGGELVDETCEMDFRLYDQESGGNQVGSAITLTVPVSDGLFTVSLDFGSGVFAGDARWLGIGVQCPGEAVYADLGRQALTAAPYALYALGAPWDGLSGVPPGFVDGIDDVGLTSVAWTDVLSRPSGLDNGDDDTTYTAGAGLVLSSTQFLITYTYRLPQTCAGGQVAEWNGSTWVCGSDDVSGDGDWLLTGNAGTTPGVHYLGTSDGVTLTLAVSGTAALRLVPDATSPNVIGGHSANSVAATVHGATIGGGGDGTHPNRVTGGDYTTIGGGAGNTVSGTVATVGGSITNTAGGVYATVGGGRLNTASGRNATVSGGYTNTASATSATVGGGWDNTASRWNATVGGGSHNTASDVGTTIGGGGFSTASGAGATIGGGWSNIASGDSATVGGGSNNTANAGGATVGGGGRNAAGGYATVGGGEYNAASGPGATVGGGLLNTASGPEATVGGGRQNVASNSYATVGGGWYNIADGQFATVGGGWTNTASGYASTVAGGRHNTASGSYSFAAGRRAKAVHQGAFVWADSTAVDYTSTSGDQFAIRASNGVSLAVDAGGIKAVAVGERYRDNGVIAWARVSATGSITTGSVYNTFGVESVAKIGAGQYAITITAQTASAELLIPMAVAEVDAVPSSAGAVRVVSVRQTGPRTFEVYINDGTFALVDNDFVFMVTGR